MKKKLLYVLGGFIVLGIELLIGYLNPELGLKMAGYLLVYYLVALTTIEVVIYLKDKKKDEEEKK